MNLEINKLLLITQTQCLSRKSSQQIGKINPMLVQCWFTVYDAGPTLEQDWVDLSFLLGIGLNRAECTSEKLVIPMYIMPVQRHGNTST